MDIITYALCRKIAKAAVSGIKNLTINGTDLIIETNDGVFLTIHFPTPADGISVVNVEIDNNKHLICTMSDGSTIDAGELPGGGGVVQATTASNFPNPGEKDTLYLETSTEKIYYWTGIKYQEISATSTEVKAELKTAKIEFDDNGTQIFDLPVDKVAVNVYVNGMYLTENEDYEIDRTVKPNQITFYENWESFDSCTITYLKPISGSGDGSDCECNFDYATKEDIDKMFEDGDGDLSSTKINYATKEDIDKLFKEEGTN